MFILECNMVVERFDLSGVLRNREVSEEHDGDCQSLFEHFSPFGWFLSYWEINAGKGVNKITKGGVRQSPDDRRSGFSRTSHTGSTSGPSRGTSIVRDLP